MDNQKVLCAHPDSQGRNSKVVPWCSHSWRCEQLGGPGLWALAGSCTLPLSLPQTKARQLLHVLLGECFVKTELFTFGLRVT